MTWRRPVRLAIHDGDCQPLDRGTLGERSSSLGQARTSVLSDKYGLAAMEANG